MNIFKQKSKTIKLKCYTTMPRLAEYFPIEHNRKTMPAWYKNMPAYIEPEHKSTLKVCPGVNDFFNLGVTVPLWCDYRITYDNGNLINVETPLDANAGMPHPNYQWAEQYPNWTHFKINNPWYFECEELIKFLVIDATWNKEDFNLYTIPPGVVEFKYQHHAHIQAFFPPGTGKLELEAGMPLVHIIPLDDRKIELEFCELDQKSYNRIVKNHRFTFDNIYYKTRKLMESKK